RITRKIAESEARRSAIYSDFSAPITERLQQMGLTFEAKARLKSVYSIWRKMQTKHIPFEEVYDLYAMRIIFDCDDPAQEKSICWQIYSAITDIYRLHPERTRDWISTPKANGYQALHLTVMGPDGNWIEVQIRSRRMDEIAELGFAAHWKYKIGEGEEERELNAWLSTIKDILENPEPNAIDFLDTLKLNLFSSEILVFTPKGELLTLPNNSSVLDVAFELHTEIGSHCIAGKVNHKLVPLSHKLQSGDQIEVLTSQSQKPKAEWMKFLATAKARTRLRSLLRKEIAPLIEQGREIYEIFLNENQLPDNNNVLTKILGTFKLENKEALFEALARNEVAFSPRIVKMLQSGSQQSILSKIIRPIIRKKSPAETPGKINTKEVYRLEALADGTTNYKLCDCCRPLPGDDVMGWVNENEEIELHQLSCPRASILKASYGPRIIAVEWGNIQT
ncbi:MAG: TGS domain-containing protein, partial [Muribaculum sp.]|nr:TGS domain-containing protein [Muribaculum sp.]